jgi:hypothetical protein
MKSKTFSYLLRRGRNNKKSLASSPITLRPSCSEKSLRQLLIVNHCYFAMNKSGFRGINVVKFFQRVSY